MSVATTGELAQALGDMETAYLEMWCADPTHNKDCPQDCPTRLAYRDLLGRHDQMVREQERARIAHTFQTMATDPHFGVQRRSAFAYATQLLETQ
mgnify:CR=1 FL=1